MRALVVAGGEAEGITLVTMRCLAAAGIEPYLAATRGFRAERLSRICRGYFRLRHEWASPVLPDLADEINELCRRWRIDVVIPIKTDDMSLVSVIEDILVSPVFPHPRLEHLRVLSDKWSFYRLLKQLEVPTPDTILLESEDWPEDEGWEFPKMVKPLAFGNCAGVRQVVSSGQLHAHIEQGGMYTCLPLILQDYVEGVDVDLSVLARDGEIVAWAVQRWGEGGRLEFVENEGILQLGWRIISHLGYNGVAHFDLREEKATGRVLMIECNPRFWGTMQAAMLFGVNFPYLGALMALGRELETENNRCQQGVYIRPALVVRTLLADLSSAGVSRPALRGLLRLVLDPLPDLYSAAVRAGERRYGKMFRNLH